MRCCFAIGTGTYGTRATIRKPGCLASLSTIRSKNTDVYRSMGMAIRMTGKIDMGISYLGMILAHSPMMLQPQVHLTLAELFAAKGDSDSLRSSLLLLEASVEQSANGTEIMV